jgi:hypothetical protein
MRQANTTLDIRNEQGQMTVEMILIATILVSVALAFSQQARSSGFLASMVEGPWKPLQGMIEDGVWMKAGDLSKGYHPNQVGRHGSDDGDPTPQP